LTISCLLVSSYQINDCVSYNITINSTLPIGENEIILPSGCQHNESKYICNCSGDTEFYIDYADNAINNYSIRVDYVYQSITASSGGGGGSTRRKPEQNITTITIIEPFSLPSGWRTPEKVQLPKLPEIQYKSDTVVENITTEPEQYTKSYAWLYAIIAAIIIIGAIIALIIATNKID